MVGGACDQGEGELMRTSREVRVSELGGEARASSPCKSEGLSRQGLVLSGNFHGGTLLLYVNTVSCISESNELVKFR